MDDKKIAVFDMMWNAHVKAHEAGIKFDEICDQHEDDDDFDSDAYEADYTKAHKYAEGISDSLKALGLWNEYESYERDRIYEYNESIK